MDRHKDHGLMEDHVENTGWLVHRSDLCRPQSVCWIILTTVWWGVGRHRWTSSETARPVQLRDSVAGTNGQIGKRCR